MKKTLILIMVSLILVSVSSCKNNDSKDVSSDETIYEDTSDLTLDNIKEEITYD